jgi:hypothetical protein
VDLVDRLPEPEEAAASPLAESDEPMEEAAGEIPVFNPMTCPRCEQPLEYAGAKRFHEGTNWGALGEIGEFFVKREQFDVYVCPNCGRVEFFIRGIGDEFRKHD